MIPHPTQPNLSFQSLKTIRNSHVMKSKRNGKNMWHYQNYIFKVFTMFEDHQKSRIWIFQFWHFLPIFVLLQLTFRFSKTRQNGQFFGIFNKLLSTQNVNLARFARNVECDFLLWFSNTVKMSYFSGIAVMLIGIPGFVANFLSIIVLGKCKDNWNFHRLLSCLAIIDMLLITQLVLEMSVLGVFVKAEPFWYVLTYPYFIHPARGIIQTCAIFMVVAVATERYRYVWTSSPRIKKGPYAVVRNLKMSQAWKIKYTATFTFLPSLKSLFQRHFYLLFWTLVWRVYFSATFSLLFEP